MSTKKQEDDPLAFVKKPNKSYTLFDHIPSDTVNLKMGAPGEPLLKKSKEIMKKATVHKMVSHVAELDDGERGGGVLEYCAISNKIDDDNLQKRSLASTLWLKFYPLCDLICWLK